jgi:RNA polymerase sigma factor (sigma-70 family)
VKNGAAESKLDDLLLPFLDARIEADSEAVLEQLIVKHVQPLIRDIIAFKLNASSLRFGISGDRQEVEDVSNEVIVRVIRTLRDYKSSPRAKSILSLRRYVATMAYNASDEYLRRKYPRRYSLKNKVRYILTRQPGLVLREGENGKALCGLARWGSPEKAVANPLREGRDGLDDFLRGRFPTTALARSNPAELVAAILEFTNSPLEIDDLVFVMAELLGIRDARPQTEQETMRPGDLLRLSSDPRGVIDQSLDRRKRLRRVWDEILQLSLRQRTALLLNLRDETGGAAIALLPLLRVATMRQVAAALEMSAEEIAALWDRLPLEDAAIGEKLGASRQQVANLRKCARERLSRRFESSRGA